MGEAEADRQTDRYRQLQTDVQTDRQAETDRQADIYLPALISYICDPSDE